MSFETPSLEQPPSVEDPRIEKAREYFRNGGEEIEMSEEGKDDWTETVPAYHAGRYSQDLVDQIEFLRKAVRYENPQDDDAEYQELIKTVENLRTALQELPF